MTIKRLFIIGLSMLSLIGCAKTSVTSVDSDTGVDVLYSVPANISYEEIGLVTTQTGQTLLHDRSNEGMIRKLQDKALKLGADAIIVNSLSESSWGFTGDNSTGFEKGKATAIAIRYME
ncbi:hypothetical protein H4F05_00100 [Vibrio cholerae]